MTTNNGRVRLPTDPHPNKIVLTGRSHVYKKLLRRSGDCEWRATAAGLG